LINLLKAAESFLYTSFSFSIYPKDSKPILSVEGYFIVSFKIQKEVCDLLGGAGDY